MLGYLLLICALLHASDVARTVGVGAALAGALVLAIALILQAVLGVLALVYHVPLALALTHQAMAVVVLTVAVVHAQRLERPAELLSSSATRGQARPQERTT
jgi:cytochrome c oxidase assembly protein subunit 15